MSSRLKLVKASHKDLPAPPVGKQYVGEVKAVYGQCERWDQRLEFAANAKRPDQTVVSHKGVVYVVCESPQG